MSFKVGDKVWVFNENHREYATDKKGHPVGGGPIYEKHFVQVEITGETSRSWLIGKWHPIKISKRDLKGIYTDEQKADAIWAHEHAYNIVRMVERLRDAAKLRQIAAIVGYQPQSEKE